MGSGIIGKAGDLAVNVTVTNSSPPQSIYSTVGKQTINQTKSIQIISAGKSH